MEAVTRRRSVESEKDPIVSGSSSARSAGTDSHGPEAERPRRFSLQPHEGPPHSARSHNSRVHTAKSSLPDIFESHRVRFLRYTRAFLGRSPATTKRVTVMEVDKERAQPTGTQPHKKKHQGTFDSDDLLYMRKTSTE
ncbi:unnamed protein product, partial [Mesorhabditis spiculigera]